MIEQLLIGTFVISLNIITQVVFVGLSIRLLKRYGNWLSKPPFLFKTIFILVAVILWLILGVTVCVWIWAAAFMVLNIFSALEPALYFATVTFTTLGYGDITLDAQWRILGVLPAVNGLIIFGLSTAFLVEFISRLLQVQEPLSE